jgi:hypothetical protein
MYKNDDEHFTIVNTFLDINTFRVDIIYIFFITVILFMNNFILFHSIFTQPLIIKFNLRYLPYLWNYTN